MGETGSGKKTELLQKQTLSDLRQTISELRKGGGVWQTNFKIKM